MARDRHDRRGPRPEEVTFVTSTSSIPTGRPPRRPNIFQRPIPRCATSLYGINPLGQFLLGLFAFAVTLGVMKLSPAIPRGWISDQPAGDVAATVFLGLVLLTAFISYRWRWKWFAIGVFAGCLLACYGITMVRPQGF